jgi:hypothetical protein
MEIEKYEKVKVNAKILQLYLKVSDRFSATLLSATGTEIFGQDDGYVPDFMPGDHFGDYVILDIDIDTGQIVNWEKPTSEQISKWVGTKEETE